MSRKYLMFTATFYNRILTKLVIVIYYIVIVFRRFLLKQFYASITDAITE